MPIVFQLADKIVGLSLHTATAGERIMVETCALVSPNDSRLAHVLEELQRGLFSRIPGLPDPPTIRHLVVVIRQDLSGTAYVNELKLTARATVARAVSAGDPVFTRDISEIHEASLGVEVPDDAAIVVVTSIGWHRSVYFDFSPFTERQSRCGVLAQILAMQMLQLLGLVDAPPARTNVDAMGDGFQALHRLLEGRCEDEAQYQELLAANPWMLGGTYSEVVRHRGHGHDVTGRRNIPDFTARRSADGMDDIVELKQPFLNCFKQDGDFSAEFNDSWNQAERYLVSARGDKEYLARLGLRLENPKCLLIVGHDWTAPQMNLVRQKESVNLSINVMRWDHLIAQAEWVLSLMRIASVRE